MMSAEEVNVINVSGGKDSTATLLLALERETGNIRAAFADTGNEHESTYEYVDYLESATGVEIQRVKPDFTEWFVRRREYLTTERAVREWPEDVRLRAIELSHPTGNPFLDLCILKGRFPSRMAQFCTQFLKREPIHEQVFMPLLEAGHRVLSWQGVRRDESRARANLPEFEADFALEIDGPGLFSYRPILDWTVEDVFAMHRKHGIEPNPLYSQGMNRVGCMPCINATKSELREIADRFPEHIERIAEWERIVGLVAKREMATFFSVSGVANEDVSLEKHGIHGRVEWSRTSRGGRQLQMFQETPACSSAYGLCE